jgi:hypothetical protein
VTFDERDARVGLDVFSADGTYLGTVMRVRWDGAGWLTGRGVKQASARPAAWTVAPSFSGERLGPMPTAALGNGGPAHQTEATRYASKPDAPPGAVRRQPAELLVFRWLVSLNWATARPVLRRIPAGLIQVVSLERIILSVNAAELG